MNYIWNPTIEQVLEAQELARSRGKVAGQDYTEEFLEIMERDNKKPSGATELTPTELLQEYASHGQNVAHIEVNSQGNETIKVIKNENFDENQ